ncbi:MAG: zinc ribbon domain-containing protein [Acidobacteria bacterium]|nr:zinc ribbon domain-containing protein [Acidobacteriota bacterium]MBI3427713.1 zinc ribbon domain-containing protein [Acidobacteriota bacterium]
MILCTQCGNANDDASQFCLHCGDAISAASESVEQQRRMVEQANLARLAASTCPNCSAAMAVVIKRSGLGLALVILGVALTPFLIGIPLFIAGYMLRFGGKGRACYRCPRCNYSSA